MATLGRTSGEINGRNVEAAQARAFYIGQMAEAGTITALQARLQGWNAASTGLLGLYKGSATAPSGAMLGSGSVSAADGVMSLQTVSGLSVAAASGDHIWLAIISSTGQLRFGIDTAPGLGYYYALQTASGTLPDPFGAPIENASDYQAIGAITYTPSGGGGATISSAQAGGAAAGALGTPSNVDTPTQVTLGCTTSVSGSGTLRAVLSTDSTLIDAVTAGQINAATLEDNSAAPFSGNVAVSGASPSLTITGLTRDTVYHGAMIVDDATDSNILRFSFRTAEPAVAITDITGPNTASIVADAAGVGYWVWSAAPGAAAPTLHSYGTLNIAAGDTVVPCGNAAVGATVEIALGWTVSADAYRAGGPYTVINANV